MTANNPSYLVKSRHGIWYFQTQIPKRFRKGKKRTLFRKSLKTTNRRRALSQARHWYVLMEKSNFEWEEDAQEIADLYSRGKIIYGKLNALDPDDSNESDEFFYSLSEYDEKALKHYNNVIVERTSIKTGNSSSVLDTSGEEKEVRLSILLDKFIIEKRRNWGKEQADSTENKDYRPKVGLFIEILDNITGNQLCKDDIVQYKETLFHIPKNRKKIKKYRNKSIQEILNLDIPENERLNDTTIKSHFTKVGTFLKWCAQNGFTQPNLESPLLGVIKKKKAARDERDPFSEDDLKKLFMNDYYQRLNFKLPNQYWIPLLGLFTGARQNELCQLYVDDIQQENDIWFIDINDKEDKRLKTINARRKVPIHSILIDKLHFLDYIEKLRRNRTQRLFPELVNGRDGHAPKFSKWFNRTYRKNTNVGQKENEKKDFHSFRHTLINYYKQRGRIDEYRVSELVGQKSDTTITYDRYAQEDSLQKRKELVELFQPDYLDFSKTRVWRR